MSDEVKKIIDQLQVRIDEANQKAEDILKAAEEKADKVMAEAENKATDKLKAADEEIARREKAHAEKLNQAVRDTLIELKKSTIQSVLNKTLDAALEQPLNDPKLVENAILTMAKEFAGKLDTDIRVLLGPEMYAKLGTVLKQKADKTIKAGLDVETDSTINGGFKIGPAAEGYVYDFSDEALVELFANAYGSEIEAQILAGDKE